MTPLCFHVFASGGSPVAQAIAQHANFTAFVFVPNLCNADCPFCYVHPTFARKARASTAVLSRAAITAEALSKLGFEEVRFTGGEPTLFSNLDRLIEPFWSHGMRYRVLTNGIDIDDHLSFFREKAPERFTISVHDTVSPESIFRVPIDADAWTQNRRKLADIAEVEATLVIQDAALEWNQADHVLNDLEIDGVKHIKVILENSRQGRDYRSFERLARELTDKWSSRFLTLRFTDTNNWGCRLPDKAFPAIDLGRSAIFACCVQVGDRTVPAGYSDELPSDVISAMVKLTSVIERSREMRPLTLPCEAGTLFCPLGLAQ